MRCERKITSLRILSWLFVSLCLVFCVEKFVFLLYTGAAGRGYAAADWLRVWWHGLKMDLSSAGYVTAVAVIFCVLGAWFRRFPLRGVLLAYEALMSFVLSLIFVGDAMLYPFWHYKLDSSVLMYLTSPKMAIASVSGWTAAAGFLAVLALAALVFLLISLPVRRRTLSPGGRLPAFAAGLLLLLLEAPLFLAIRGGVKESTMNVGKAYFSDDRYLNHAAVNPAFSLLSSLKLSGSLREGYEFLPEGECGDIAGGLLSLGEGQTERIVSAVRPNVLLIVMESFGADLVGCLGGIEGVTPRLDSIASRGVFFPRCYAGSFRTDRGVFCINCGFPALPNASMMGRPRKWDSFESLISVFSGEGYSTAFYYGGDIDFTKMRGWLYNCGVDRIVSDEDFPPKERHYSKWGVRDDLVFGRLYDDLSARDDDCPWFVEVLSQSSHEPFQVPSEKFADAIPNAFAYSDSVLGNFIDGLKALPLWDNLLVVITADHGYYYADEGHPQSPRVHNIPLIFTGGAVNGPGRKYGKIMNQTDIPATLLSQLGIDASGFPFSRDVLSSAYTEPFAFYTFINGFCVLDGDGATLYDCVSSSCVTDEGDPDGGRLLKGKAILQSLCGYADGL